MTIADASSKEMVSLALRHKLASKTFVGIEAVV